MRTFGKYDKRAYGSWLQAGLLRPGPGTCLAAQACLGFVPDCALSQDMTSRPTVAGCRQACYALDVGWRRSVAALWRATVRPALLGPPWRIFRTIWQTGLQQLVANRPATVRPEPGLVALWSVTVNGSAWGRPVCLGFAPECAFSENLTGRPTPGCKQAC